MSNGGSGKAMDAELEKLKKWRKLIVKDGACLFRCVSEFFKGTQQYHLEYRRKCLEYIRDNAEHYQNYLDVDVSFPAYLAKMALASSWAGHIEIDALSKVYGLKFTIFRELPVYEVDKEFEPPLIESNDGPLFQKSHIEVCYAGNNHYDLVMPLRYRTSAEWVQGLVYDLVNNALKLPLSPTCHNYKDPEFETWRREREVREVEGFSTEEYRKILLEEEGWDVAGKGGKKKPKKKGNKHGGGGGMLGTFRDFGHGGDDTALGVPTDFGRVDPPKITDDPSSFPSLGGLASVATAPKQALVAQAGVSTPPNAGAAAGGCVWGARKNWGTAFQPSATGADASSSGPPTTAAPVPNVAEPETPRCVFKRPAWAPTPIMSDATVCYAKQNGGCRACDSGTCSVGLAVAARRRSRDVAAAISAVASIADMMQTTARLKVATSNSSHAEEISSGDRDGDGTEETVVRDDGPDAGERSNTEPTDEHGTNVPEECAQQEPPAEMQAPSGSPHGMGQPQPPVMEGGIHYHNGQPFMMTPQGLYPVQFVPGPNGQFMAAPMPYFYPPQGMMMGHPRGGGSGPDEHGVGVPYGSPMMHYPPMQQPYNTQYYQGGHPHMYQGGQPTPYIAPDRQ